jgi:hypothetical protein
LIRQLGSALAASHAAGVAHLDLKPENVMIRNASQPDETATLIDFGIAKVDRAGIDANVTMIAIGGTVRYMAPEQFEGLNTPACDVYALSLIGSEMLCGKPDVRALPGGTRRAVRRALERAQAFDAAARPSDVRAWSESLAGAMTRDRRWVAAAASAAVATLVFGLLVASRMSIRAEPDVDRVIEKVSAFYPESEGFSTHGDVTGTVVQNRERAGYDAWRITSRRQGYYYHRLTDRQKAMALERGWTLKTVMRADEGLAFVGVDFGPGKRRYDIVHQIEDGRHLARLQTQLVPTFLGFDAVLDRTDVYHAFEMRFDPAMQVADLYIDGVKALTGKHRCPHQSVHAITPSSSQLARTARTFAPPAFQELAAPDAARARARTAAASSTVDPGPRPARCHTRHTVAALTPARRPRLRAVQRPGAWLAIAVSTRTVVSMVAPGRRPRPGASR